VLPIFVEGEYSVSNLYYNNLITEEDMMFEYRSLKLFSTLIICLIGSTSLFAQQNLPFIRVSPQAKAVQNISFATIEINYSRPAVKGREIYGKLVPYGLAPNAFGNGKPMPWRAGANENTTMSLSHQSKINGNLLPAGTYGLHMIVQEHEWTIIFNKDYQAWGSFFYEESNDVLRIQVRPQKVESREWLMYGFENLSDNSADVFMHWGDQKIIFKIEVDKNKIVLDTYREQLTNLPGFNQAAWAAAARYCLNNNINTDEAMNWIDKALSMNGGQNFTNNVVKGGLLALTGKKAEGDKLIATAMASATETELNTYGYQLMGQNRLDEALEIFKSNIEKFPESWNTYDSYGEALAKKGDKKGARQYYEKALEMAPAQQKGRIEGILKGLE
jgi:tetratricopeptide (TPR) repeat protein